MLHLIKEAAARMRAEFNAEPAVLQIADQDAPAFDAALAEARLTPAPDGTLFGMYVVRVAAPFSSIESAAPFPAPVCAVAFTTAG